MGQVVALGKSVCQTMLPLWSKRVGGCCAAYVDFAVKRRKIGLDACYVGFPDYVGGFRGWACGEAGHGAVTVKLRPLILVLVATGGSLNLNCEA